MDKVFLCTDQQQINNKLSMVNSAISEFKPFYERYKALNLKVMVTEDLQEFLTTPKTFFLNVLTGGDCLNVGQLQLDPEKVYDLSPRPPGVDALVSDITNKITDYSIQRNYIGQIQYMAISDNRLDVSPGYIDELNQSFTYYAETEDQKNALIILNRVTEDMNTLRDLRKEPMYGENTFAEHLIGGFHGSPFKANLKNILGF